MEWGRGPWRAVLAFLSRGPQANKERMEWGRGPWRAVLAFLPRGPRVPSYATGLARGRGSYA
jgi:hypothetical protein